MKKKRISYVVLASFMKTTYDSGASFVFLFIFLHLGRAIFYVSYFYNTRAYFTGVTILISLPTGTKIFNWLTTYLGTHLYRRKNIAYASVIPGLLHLERLVMRRPVAYGPDSILLGQSQIKG